MTLAADSMLLKDRGMVVYTVAKLDNIPDLIAEVKPDVVFFDAVTMDNDVKEAYNTLVGNSGFKDIPVILTVAEDELYLVTHSAGNKRDKTDNVFDAVKIALRSDITPLRWHYKGRQGASQLRSPQLPLHAMKLPG